VYVVVAGGGKVGFYLAKTLINEGHEVLVIERDQRKADARGCLRSKHAQRSRGKPR